MNKIINKQTKKIIIMILIVLLFNFVVPNYTFAINGGIFFKPIAQFIAHLADLILSGLHLFFVGSGDMIENDTYAIRYSPGIIFSGIIPAFEVDFINPDLTYEVETLQTNPIGSPSKYEYTLEMLDIKNTSYLEYENIIKLVNMVKEFMKTGNLKDAEGRVKLTTEPFYDKRKLHTAESWFEHGIEVRWYGICIKNTRN